MRLALLVDQDVGGLDIAVQDTALVRMRDRLGDPRHQPGDRRRPIAERREKTAQILAVDPLHAVVEHPLVLAAVQDGDDVRVVQGRDGLGLAAEEPDVPLIGEAAGLDHLERDDAIEPLLPGLEDDSHAAGAKPPEQLIFAEGGAGASARQTVDTLGIAPGRRPGRAGRPDRIRRIIQRGGRARLRIGNRLDPIRGHGGVDRPGVATRIGRLTRRSTRLLDRAQPVGREF